VGARGKIVGAATAGAAKRSLSSPAGAAWRAGAVVRPALRCFPV